MNIRRDDRRFKKIAGSRATTCIQFATVAVPLAPGQTTAVAYSGCAKRRSMACFRLPGGSAASPSRA